MAETNDSKARTAAAAARVTLVCAVVAALSGCGNAYESLSMGKWQEVGVAKPPQLTGKGEFEVTTLTAGDGRHAEAGDLVKAEVLVTTSRAGGAARTQADPRTIWIWLGIAGSPPDLVELETFGNLGTPRLRRAFIGRQLHERFRMQLTPGAVSSGDSLPVNGIIGDHWTMLDTVARVGDRRLRPREWPSLKLRDGGDGEPSAEVTVLAICDAKVFRRTAILRQKGAFFPWGEFHYDFNRKGTIGWTAIDAQCPAPDGHVRFEAGPFYDSPLGSDGTRLAGWSKTYVRKRPAKKHPGEWEPAP